MAAQVITLLIDFGTTDADAGIVRGMLLACAPAARIVGLVHAAEFGSARHCLPVARRFNLASSSGGTCRSMRPA